MLAAKYADCVHCVMCFRLFPREKATATSTPDDDCGEQEYAAEQDHAGEQEYYAGERLWSSYAVDRFSAFVADKWKPQPLQGVILQAVAVTSLQQQHADGLASETLVRVCQHCSSFFRKNEHRARNKIPELPMALAIDYIMSGGCTQSPCSKMLLHCMESLAYNFPHNPLLLWKQDQEKLMGLQLRVQLIINHLNMFEEMDVTFLCLIRWVAEGSQHFMVDADFARKVRRYVDQNGAALDWWQERAPTETTCRKCMPCRARALRDKVAQAMPDKATTSSYSSVLVFSSPNPEIRIDKCLEAIEREAVVIDGVTVFCTLCTEVSVISHEYDCLVRSATGGAGISRFEDIYYDRLLQFADGKRKKRSTELSKKKDCALE